MIRVRPPVDVLAGRAPAAVRGIEGDFLLLDSGLRAPGVRTWTCPETAVVLGVGRELEADVDLEECERRGVAVLRRASGGGTVVIGPGTIQYAFLARHRDGEAPPSIEAVKRASNRRVATALARAGLATPLRSDDSGDLCAGDRKVGGLALRRRRHATLLHGTLLVDADLEAVAALLRHPSREPAWRRGRSHVDFLANLGAFDAAVFAVALSLGGR